jgi:hypothetical protein
MEPDSLLQEILENAQMVVDGGEVGLLADSREGHLELAQKIIDLNEWLERGGILPRDWSMNRNEHGNVFCKFCLQAVPASLARLHEGEWVGEECCWREQLAG